MNPTYLDLALDFPTSNEENEKGPTGLKPNEYEENELNEISPASGQDSSFSSFVPCPHRLTKVQLLANTHHSIQAAWRQSVEAGIRHSKAGRVDPRVIQEDIGIWRMLATNEGWPSAPADICQYELNEERRVA